MNGFLPLSDRVGTPAEFFQMPQGFMKDLFLFFMRQPVLVTFE